MIAEAVKRIRNGSNEIIEIGDMTVKKEWTFAGDIMKGVLTLIEQDMVLNGIIMIGVIVLHITCRIRQRERHC